MRMPPRDFLPRSTVDGDFRAWITGGVWATSTTCFIAGPGAGRPRREPHAVIIDSQKRENRRGSPRNGRKPRGKAVKGRKRHLVTDTLGLTPRSRSIRQGAGSRRRRARPRPDQPALPVPRAHLRGRRLPGAWRPPLPRVPSRSSGAPTPCSSCSRRADAIERTFAWACINRRLAGDVGRFAETAKALFQIAMIKLMIRRIARFEDFGRTAVSSERASGAQERLLVQHPHPNRSARVGAFGPAGDADLE